MAERIVDVPEERDRIERTRIFEEVDVADRDGGHVASQQRFLVDPHVPNRPKDHRHRVRRASPTEQIGDFVGDEGCLGPLIAGAIEPQMGRARSVGLGGTMPLGRLHAF